MMRLATSCTAALCGATMMLAGCANSGGLFNRPGERVYNPQAVNEGLADNDVVYRDQRGRYYCRRENGTTGTLIGAGAGALLGNLIAPGGSKAVGTIIGGAGGAVAGRAVAADRRLTIDAATLRRGGMSFIVAKDLARSPTKGRLIWRHDASSEDHDDAGTLTLLHDGRTLVIGPVKRSFSGRYQRCPT